MTVVRNEYETRRELDPASVLFKRLQSIAYDWHNYGNSTIGNRSRHRERRDREPAGLLSHATTSRTTRCCWWPASFDEAKALQLVATHFGAIPQPDAHAAEAVDREPTQDGERSFIVRRVGDMQVVVVAYKSLGAACGFAGAGLCRRDSWDTPIGPPAQGAGGDRQGRAGFGWHAGRTWIGAIQIFGAVVKKGDPVEPVRDELIRHRRETSPTIRRRPQEMERARIRLANAVRTHA